MRSLVVEDNGGLDSALVLHGLQALSPLVQLESLVDDSCDFYLARVEIVDGGREHVGLRERSKDCDLVAKDLAGRPGYTSSGRIDTIHNQFTTSSNVVDGILKNLGRSGGFNDDVKAVWVVILDLLELNFWVRTGEFDVFVSSTKLSGQVHLDTLRSSDDDLAATILSKHLGKN